MILKTEKNAIDLQEDSVLVDGQSVVRGKFTHFFTDQTADSTFHLDSKGTEPKVGQILVVFQEGEDHPVYQSLPITEIQ
ncbi:hypothetical protein HQ571_04460 [Candidatus Kuenenbacteria bacterium]|nr:hypothetical protein [Candidatus Kuenenbacteria bacterium]